MCKNKQPLSLIEYPSFSETAVVHEYVHTNSYNRELNSSTARFCRPFDSGGLFTTFSNASSLKPVYGRPAGMKQPGKPVIHTSRLASSQRTSQRANAPSKRQPAKQPSRSGGSMLARLLPAWLESSDQADHPPERPASISLCVSCCCGRGCGCSCSSFVRSSACLLAGQAGRQVSKRANERAAPSLRLLPML